MFFHFPAPAAANNNNSNDRRRGCSTLTHSQSLEKCVFVGPHSRGGSRFAVDGDGDGIWGNVGEALTRPSFSGASKSHRHPASRVRDSNQTMWVGGWGRAANSSSYSETINWGWLTEWMFTSLQPTSVLHNRPHLPRRPAWQTKKQRALFYANSQSGIVWVGGVCV